MMIASAILSKSRALLIEACTMIRSSCVKPLRSSNMSDRSPSLRWITGSIWTRKIQQPRRRETYCFTLSPFCLPLCLLWIRTMSRENHSTHVFTQCVNTLCSSAATNASPRRSQTCDVASMYWSPDLQAMRSRVRNSHWWKLAASP